MGLGVQIALCVFTACAFGAAAYYAHIARLQKDTMNDTLTETRKQTGFAEKSSKGAADAASSAQDALKLARDNFRQDQRPYVWLRNDLLFPTHIEATKDGKVTDRRAIWDWHYTNYGKTPALHVRFISKMNIGENAGKEGRRLGPIPSSTGTPLPPGKDDFSAAISPTAITNEELIRLINGYDGSVIVYGRIEYTDGGGTPYETGFCFRTLKTHAVSYCDGKNDNYMK